jgi:hypothetical protein
MWRQSWKLCKGYKETACDRAFEGNVQEMTSHSVKQEKNKQENE